MSTFHYALRHPRHALMLLSRGHRRRRALEAFVAPAVPPCLVIDIGASHFSHARWRIFQRAGDAHWLLIDPDEASLNYVQNWPHASKATRIPQAVGSEEGTFSFFLTNVRTGSSLLRPIFSDSVRLRFGEELWNYFYPCEETHVDVVRLSSAISSFDHGQPRILKLDTQGTEFAILKSESERIRSGQLIGVETESSLLAVPLYEGATKFHELQEWFEGLGWELLAFHVNRGERERSPMPSMLVPAECDVVFGPRLELVETLDLSSRLVYFAFLCANLLYREAQSALATFPDVAQALNLANQQPPSSTQLKEQLARMANLVVTV